MDIETPQDALTIRLHGADNVITAKETIAAGTRLAGEDVETRGDIPVGQLVARAAGAVISKLGVGGDITNRGESE